MLWNRWIQGQLTDGQDCYGEDHRQWAWSWRITKQPWASPELASELRPQGWDAIDVACGGNQLARA